MAECLTSNVRYNYPLRLEEELQRIFDENSPQYPQIREMLKNGDPKLYDFLKSEFETAKQPLKMWIQGLVTWLEVASCRWVVKQLPQ